MPTVKRHKSDKYIEGYWVMGTQAGVEKPRKIYYVTSKKGGKVMEEKAVPLGTRIRMKPLL